jgi:glycosyltransferase involved in cell wall biosynthesis
MKTEQEIMKNWYSSEFPLLSICCATYNHEFFIEKCLNGFLMQETNFPFEIIIHDDASTDKTVNIIQKYVKMFPTILRPIYESENQYSKGIKIYADIIFPYIRGKYVIFCDGDDYWTDPFKILKQINFLEKNKEYSMCFHPVYIKFEEDKSKTNEIFPSPHYRKYNLSLTDLLNYNFPMRCSIVYRWRFNNKTELDILIKEYKNINIGGDYLLSLLHAEKGNIGFIDNVMVVYRKHKNGLWYNLNNTKTNEFYLKWGIKLINLYQMMEKRYNIDKSDEINYIVCKYIYTLLDLQDFTRLKEFQDLYPELYNSFLRTNLDVNFYQLLKLLLKYFKFIDIFLPEDIKRKKTVRSIISLLKLFKSINTKITIIT